MPGASGLSTERLAADADPDVPFVLVNHWPLVREPTRVLRHPEFAQWCGTELTADWHTRFPTAAVVYGHLHIPARPCTTGYRSKRSPSATRGSGAAAASPPTWPARSSPAFPRRGGSAQRHQVVGVD